MAEGTCSHLLPGSRLAGLGSKVEEVSTQTMDNISELHHALHPLLRITTLGEFAIERLVCTHSLIRQEPPRYAPVTRSEWSSRGPAMTLLKVLLCRVDRRASRSELIEAIWPNHKKINADHALDSAASVLRRHILRLGEVGSLLLTLRSDDEAVFKLAGQQRIWVDADAFLSLVSKASLTERQGQSPLPLLEEAYALVGGEFLEDDLYAPWAQPRRHTLNGARHRTLFRLADLYLKDGRAGLAEELLFAALEDEPADEDVLCRLMVLLVQQERRQEALTLYGYTEDLLQEEQAEPAIHTRELARRIRQGLMLREQEEHLAAPKGQLLSLARPQGPLTSIGMASMCFAPGEPSSYPHVQTRHLPSSNTTPCAVKPQSYRCSQLAEPGADFLLYPGSRKLFVRRSSNFVKSARGASAIILEENM